jgi:hypothetical protein
LSTNPHPRCRLIERPTTWQLPRPRAFWLPICSKFKKQSEFVFVLGNEESF